MIPIAKPYMDEIEAQAAGRAILSGWVTQGPEVAAFEREFASVVGASYACAVSNCTTALHLALLSLGVQPGDEVITVSHTFIASVNAIRYCGAVPVFVDIDSHTFNINPQLIEAAITSKTKAILCVHQIGMPCDLAKILAIAKQFNLRVIEDAACAIGSEINWQGSWESIGKPRADIACFSFHPRKIVSTGDGGMLTTNDEALNAKFRLLRQHAMSVPDTIRHAAKQIVFEEYTEVGFNYRMTDIQAAVGREQLKRLPTIVNRRRELADRYAELLTPYKYIGLPYEPEWAKSNWQSYCIYLPPQANQYKVMQTMLEQGISTRRAVMCVHREPAYALDKGGYRASGNLLHSEYAQDHAIVLPLFHQMTHLEQEKVVDSLIAAVL